jgi:hypothetical protein
MKKVYRLAIDTDAVAPAVGATLEYLKSVGGRDLPTNFEELELDCQCQLTDTTLLTFDRLWPSQL